MTKSRITLIALAICCIALLSASTAAYFVVQGTAYNVITTGVLDIDLHEKTTDGAEPDTPLQDLPDWQDKGGVMPGMNVSKIVYVENIGDQPAYVRIKLEKHVTAADESELSTDVLVLDLDTANWTEKDGWYYYNSPLPAGENTIPLFNSVYFDAQTGNEYQNATATVKVSVQAVQVANNGATVMDAAGWPVEIEEPEPTETPEPIEE